MNAPSATLAPTFNASLLAYPNPVQNTLYVHFSGDAGATFQLRLVNAQKCPMLEQTVEASAAENNIAIPVAKLAPGVYEVMLLRNGAAVGRTRVVKI